MSGRPRPEPVQVIKTRRDAALAELVGSIPYAAYLGISVDRRGDELTCILAYAERNIGNPMLPALHGGAVAAFLETAAILELAWSQIWERMEGEGQQAPRPRLPKTIDLTVDYLRTGLPRDAYARGRIVRAGRRYASVQVEAWQDNRSRPFAQATGHFLMPEAPSQAPDATAQPSADHV